MNYAKSTGASKTPTGSITAATASLLTFSTTDAGAVNFLSIYNAAGARCYIKLNDAASPAVDATHFDFSLADQGSLILSDEVKVKNVSIYTVSGTAVNVVGW